jgi:predicted MFS family arabinose efflux permease
VLIALLSAGNFVIGMGAFVVIGMLGPMAASFGVAPAEAGLALTVYALAYALASPAVVAATGGWSRRGALVAGLGLFALAAALSALAPTPAALYAARVLAAIGAGLFTPNAAAVAVSCSPPERRGAALSNVFFGLTLAQVIGVPAGGFAAYAIGWQASFLVVALIALPVLAGLWRATPPDLPFQPTRLATLGAALADWRTLLAVLLTATFLGAIYVPYTYLAPLLAATMGWQGPGIAAALFAFGLGAVAGNLLGGRLADRIGPARTLAGLALAQIALMPLLSALPAPGPATLALLFVWSVCGWSFMAPQQARLVRLAPDRPNVVLALNAAAIYVGAAAGSALGAAAIARFGVEGLGLVGAAAMLVGLANLGLALRAERAPAAP